MIETLWKTKGNGNTRLDMEIDPGFRLYIHHRDFIAGRTIVANILHGIQKSRRVIFIMSK